MSRDLEDLAHLKRKLDALDWAECYVIEIIGKAALLACEEWITEMDDCHNFLDFMAYIPRSYEQEKRDLKAEIDELSEKLKPL